MMSHSNKVSFLDLGRLDVDNGFFIRGATAALASDPHPDFGRRRCAVIAAVVEVPSIGPVLFDTGCAQNADTEWPPPAWDAFERTVYEEEHHLDVALASAGYGVEDIRAVVMGHLHLDHAGGLELFRGTDVPVYAHGDEIRNHYYAVATKEDIGAYVPGDLDWSLNWRAIDRDETELFPGVTVRHMPGHTPGLLTMQVETRNSGHFMLTSDLYHVHELFEDDMARQGWLQRDSLAWERSHRWMKQLQHRYDATMLFGHDAETLEHLVAETGGTAD